MQNNRSNLGFKHKCGVLMAVSSLPGKYGIGTFGKPCFDFIDFLDQTGQTCWQILPLNPTAYGDSPYQSPCSFAGNPYFIDPEDLYARRLIDKEELKSAVLPQGRVSYCDMFFHRIPLLKKAYRRFKKNSAYRRFVKTNAEWLDDYALFMALKEKFAYKPFIEWDDDYKYHDRAVLHEAELVSETGFWKWVQFEFSTQWKRVRKYAREKRIKIIGDMPIYVAYDSVDVWRSPKDYLLDGELKPTLVAGCPPDGFSPDGQLWGNPIYNWDRMRADGFDWWIRRVKRNFALYDVLRIDHFRGFAGYYAIPYGESTAKNGKWHDCYGKLLFDKIKERIPNAKVIAEDLGFITPDVRELLEYTGFPGMKPLQFAFYDDDSEFLPRNYPDDNCIVYSGTHDSDCTATWCQCLDGKPLERFMRECPLKRGENMTDALIRFAFNSKAVLAIVPMQDYLLLKNEQGRMNTPATASGNWTWRADGSYGRRKIREKMLALAKETKRAKKQI